MASNNGDMLKIQSRSGTVTLTPTQLSFRPKFGSGDTRRWEIDRNLIASVEIIHRSALGWNLAVHILDGRSLRLDWVPANDAEQLYETLTSGAGIAEADVQEGALANSAPAASSPASPLPFAPLVARPASAADEGWNDTIDHEPWQPAFTETNALNTASESERLLDDVPVWKVLPPVADIPTEATNAATQPAPVAYGVDRASRVNKVNGGAFRATANESLLRFSAASRTATESVWQRLRAAPRNAQLGIGCGAVLAVFLFCCVGLLLMRGIGGPNSSPPNTAQAAFSHTPVVGATQDASATATAAASATAADTATATNTPQSTTTPTPQPTATPAPQLTLLFTCASAANHIQGRLCVNTRPGATLSISVRYACNNRYQPGLTQKTADSNGNASWLWLPSNRCAVKSIVATVIAHWNGQTLIKQDSFPWS